MADVASLMISLKADIRGLATGMRQATGKVRQFGQDSAKHAKAIGRNFREMSAEISNTLKQSGQAMTSAGRSIGMMGAAVTAATGLMVREWATFEQGLVSIKGLLGEDTSALGAIEAQITRLAMTTGESTASLSKSWFDAQSAIGDTTKAMDLMEEATKLSVAGNSSLEETTSGLLTLMEAYGPTLGSAAAGADLLFMAQVKARASIGELASAAGKFLPTAGQLGVKAEEVMAAFAKMTVGLGDANFAATGMQGVLMGLMKPTKDLTAYVKEHYNMTVTQAVAQGDLMDILKKVSDLDAERIGQMFVSREAIKGLMTLRGNFNQLEKDGADILAGATARQVAYNQQLDTLTRKTAQAKESYDALVREGIAPVATAVKLMISENLIPMLEGTRQWIIENEELATTIAKVAAVLGPVGVAGGAFLIIAGQMVFAIGALVPVISAVIGGIGSLIAGISAMGAAMVAGGMSVAALTGLVAAFAALVVVAAYNVYKLVEAVIALQKAKANAAKQEIDNVKAVNRGVKEGAEHVANLTSKYKDLNEEDKKLIENLKHRFEVNEKLQVQTEQAIKNEEITAEQGKAFREAHRLKVISLQSESVELENMLDKKYEIIKATTEETKATEQATTATKESTTAKVAGTDSTDKFNEQMAKYTEQMKAGTITQDEYQQKLSGLLDKRNEETSSTLRARDALEDHTAAYDRGTDSVYERARAIDIAKAAQARQAAEQPSRGFAGAIRQTVRTVGSIAEALAMPFQLGQITRVRPGAETTTMRMAQGGIPYVPRTGAYGLHRGEKVVPRGVNEGGTGQVTIVNTIDPSMVNELIDPNVIINTINADIVKRGVTRKVVKGVISGA